MPCMLPTRGLLQRASPSAALPPGSGNPSAKPLKSSRVAEQRCAKCSSNKQHKNGNLWLFTSTHTRRQASPSQEFCSVIHQPNKETSVNHTQLKHQSMYCRIPFPCKTLKIWKNIFVFQQFDPLAEVRIWLKNTTTEPGCHPKPSGGKAVREVASHHTHLVVGNCPNCVLLGLVNRNNWLTRTSQRNPLCSLCQLLILKLWWAEAHSRAGRRSPEHRVSSCLHRRRLVLGAKAELCHGDTGHQMKSCLSSWDAARQRNSGRGRVWAPRRQQKPARVSGLVLRETCCPQQLRVLPAPPGRRHVPSLGCASNTRSARVMGEPTPCTRCHRSCYQAPKSLGTSSTEIHLLIPCIHCACCAFCTCLSSLTWRKEERRAVCLVAPLHLHSKPTRVLLNKPAIPSCNLAEACICCCSSQRERKGLKHY